jgi:hypothetical protein
MEGTKQETELVSHLLQPLDPDVARARYFRRHLMEMAIVMWVGMAAGGLVVKLISSTVLASDVRGLTTMEVSARYPELICLVLATGVVVSMSAWMRYRAMAQRPTTEMAMAMIVPLVPIFGLLWVGMIGGALACGMYCISMIPAMIAAMLIRRDVYMRWHTGHTPHAA